ncbi:MAG: SpoIIE family protein phosphatase [Candidatus Aenigmatarchaeota archaeon]
MVREYSVGGMNISVFQYFPGGKIGGDFYDVYKNGEKFGFFSFDNKGKNLHNGILRVFKKLKKMKRLNGYVPLAGVFEYANNVACRTFDMGIYEIKRSILADLLFDYGIEIDPKTMKPKENADSESDDASRKKAVDGMIQHLKDVDDMDHNFVAATGVVWDRIGNAEFGIAAQEPGFFYDASENRLIDISNEYPDLSGGYIGVFKDSKYNTIQFKMDIGDMLILFTDGIEAIRMGFGSDDDFSKEDMFNFCYENLVHRGVGREQFVTEFKTYLSKLNQSYMEDALKSPDKRDHEKRAVRDDISLNVLEFNPLESETVA